MGVLTVHCSNHVLPLALWQRQATDKSMPASYPTNKICKVFLHQLLKPCIHAHRPMQQCFGSVIRSCLAFVKDGAKTAYRRADPTFIRK